MMEFTDYIPARLHEFGPGEWGVIERATDNYYRCGKLSAYLIATVLNTKHESEYLNQCCEDFKRYCFEYSHNDK